MTFLILYMPHFLQAIDTLHVGYILHRSDERRGLMTWSSKSQANKENLVI